MADQDIGSLDALTGAGVSPSNDLVPIVDASDTAAGKTKQISVTELFKSTVAIPNVTTLTASTSVLTPIVDSGAATDLLLKRNGVTGITVGTAGTTVPQLTISTAVGKIIPGATSISLRNNADSADNLLISDAGNAIFRGTIAASNFAFIRSYLAGLTLSTAGGSGTMSIAAGQAADSTNVSSMSIAAFTKTTSGWAVGTGNGGLDSGSIANATWYHFFLIQRTDTNVVDVLISLSATSPSMPISYTLFRRIGSGLTNGSAQWILFSQVGEEFLWSVSLLDVNAVNPGAAAVSRTLTVPTGVKVWAITSWDLQNAATGVAPYGYISSLDQSDETPGAGTALNNIGSNIQAAASSSAHGWGQLLIRTNTSAQIRSRLSASDGNVTLFGRTQGWRDRRGKDS